MAFQRSSASAETAEPVATSKSALRNPVHASPSANSPRKSINCKPNRLGHSPAPSDGTASPSPPGRPRVCNRKASFVASSAARQGELSTNFAAIAARAATQAEPKPAKAAPSAPAVAPPSAPSERNFSAASAAVASASSPPRLHARTASRAAAAERKARGRPGAQGASRRRPPLPRSKSQGKHSVPREVGACVAPSPVSPGGGATEGNAAMTTLGRSSSFSDDRGSGKRGSGLATPAAPSLRPPPSSPTSASGSSSGPQSAPGPAQSRRARRAKRPPKASMVASSRPVFPASAAACSQTAAARPGTAAKSPTFEYLCRIAASSTEATTRKFALARAAAGPPWVSCREEAQHEKRLPSKQRRKTKPTTSNSWASEPSWAYTPSRASGFRMEDSLEVRYCLGKYSTASPGSANLPRNLRRPSGGAASSRISKRTPTRMASRCPGANRPPDRPAKERPPPPAPADSGADNSCKPEWLSVTSVRQKTRSAAESQEMQLRMCI
mmetsp:Transcript_24995/g.80756  ORF Transcript_24995/g.80756 Transcript_24995/m.80756 type:complete len:498 (+) Transcript_24995:161-1654(+)